MKEYLSDDTRIKLLQYENLRRHFTQLIKEVLGEGYYNEGMDVYKCDEFSCRDLKDKMKKIKLDYNKVLWKNFRQKTKYFL